MNAPAKEPFIKRILVPVDASDASTEAFSWAADLAARVGAKIDLVYVWGARSFVTHEVFLELPSQANEAVAEFSMTSEGMKMRGMLEELRQRDLRGVGRLEYGSAAEAIVKLASKDHYDLIVMGTHGRKGAHRALLGSVAEATTRDAPCPVTTIHGS